MLESSEYTLLNVFVFKKRDVNDVNHVNNYHKILKTKAKHIYMIFGQFTFSPFDAFEIIWRGILWTFFDSLHTPS